MSDGSRQLPLPLPPTESNAAVDFVADASNAEALAWLARPAEWPAGRLLLYGPVGSGKTHLLRATAAAQGWQWRSAATLPGLPEPAPGDGIAIDDADATVDEPALLHTLNLALDMGQRVLLAGRTSPAGWPLRLPDLASRLRAVAAVAIGAPSEALLGALLAKQLADRQLRVEPAAQAWLLRRLPREATAIVDAVARLDRAALAAGRRPGLALLRHVFAELAEDDGSVSDAVKPCHAGDPLL